MATHEETIEIEAPPDQVWAVLADIENWPAWTRSITSAQRLTPGGLAPGAEFRIRQPRLPAVVWTVDDVVPGRSFSWRSSSPGIESRGDHRVELSGDGSRAVLVFAQTGLLVFLSDLVFARLVRQYVRTEAEGLKRYVEQRHVGGGRPT